MKSQMALLIILSTLGQSRWQKLPAKDLLMNVSCIMAAICHRSANEAERINIISHLKEGAPGKDEIVARSLKCISDSIAYPLAQVTNFPFLEELNIAPLTPLLKAKDPMMFNNYHPISLISVFAKILERLMYNGLLKFINKYQFFNNNNNNGPNGHLFYVGGDLMMRRGMLPIIMLPDGDLRIVLHLVPF